MRIEAAGREHAPLIAKAVMMAVGDEICEDFAGESHSIADVEGLFTALAGMDDSQYSYVNTLVAVDDESGEVMGLCVGYAGAELHRLRRRFFEGVRVWLGKDMEGMADETSGDEFYIDTLATMPEHRGKGVGTALLRGMVARAHDRGLPAGLLVEKNNDNAARLYESIGFRYVDDRPFAGILMSHLRFNHGE